MPNALDAFLSTVERNARLDAEALAPGTPAARHPPRALVLVVIVSRCECGRVYRTPNANTLVRYDATGLEHSVQFTRRDTVRFAMLPRETREHHVTVPYCEDCFNV